MADKTITEQLQPSLLDRLTDDAPTETTETAHEMTISINRLREIIRRDLGWLLNATNNSTAIGADTYPHAHRSTLNFGVSEVAGDFSTGERIENVRRSMIKAITNFEPRIDPASLDVVVSASDAASAAVVEFEIRANMWAQPLPKELYLRSLVDMSTGDLTFE